MSKIRVNAIENLAAGMPDQPAQSCVFVGQVNGYGSTNTVIRRFTTVYLNQGTDITYADSPTLGASFTVNKSGVYAMSFTDGFTAAADMGISRNSNQLTTGIGAINGADRIAEVTTPLANTRGACSVTRYLQAGDVIRPHNGGTAVGTQTASVMFTMSRVS